VISIELGELNGSADITMTSNNHFNPTAKIGARKFRIALDFDPVSTLPRRHKVMLFGAAIKRNPTLASIDADLNTAVDYILDQCIIVPNTVCS
jgi:hypothetical protein